jgi:imidazolonepropionase-like amidohydrolase
MNPMRIAGRGGCSRLVRPWNLRLALTASLAIAACAASPAPRAAAAAGSSTTVARQPLPWTGDPYPSTYKPFPGVPTLVRDVTIFDGEGGRIDNGAVLFADGKIVQIGREIEPPTGAKVIVGAGKWVTPGIIDIHSHMGDYAVPEVASLADGNELTSPVTSEVWAEHSVWPQDPQFSRALMHGGVTTVQVLPGSGNLFGGRSVVLKLVSGRTVQEMKFPGAPYGLKMACGENPKTVYGPKGRMPSTRMGDIALDRITWAKAVEYRSHWEAYEKTGGIPPARDLQLDTLAAVLDGKILVHNHCYRADDMAQVIDMAKEFGYHVTAFHHAVEAYKIADLLKANNICSAVFAEQIPMKLEAVDGIPENLALLYKSGACVMAHSDSGIIVQELNLEVAKMVAAGRRMGIDIPDAVAWEFLSYNPAKALGIADRTGSLKPGKMADVVLWNGNPFSSYSRPEKVWIDGALLYDMLDPKLRPIADFELGNPGEEDTK